MHHRKHASRTPDLPSPSGQNRAVPRRAFLAAGAGLAGAGLIETDLAAPALAAGRLGWAMVTSWPKNSPGPGLSAQRLAERIAAMSGGRLSITVYGAGEIVPALEVFDAVAGGTAEMGHTASFFWQGKAPASVFFTTVPFGLTAGEHSAWIHHGGGQALWDGLYADLGVRPFMAGNTGMQMGGWFTREIAGLDDLAGLKYRIPGLGGEVFRRLGALPVMLAPTEILPALQTGVVDGAEFLGPWSDLAFGFHRAAPYYYWPGFHEPNGTGECLVNRARFEALPGDLQAVVANACAAENAYALAETDWHNAAALDRLVAEHGVEVRGFPEDVLAAARTAAEAVLAETAAQDATARAVYESFAAARRTAIRWSGLSLQAFLEARAPDAAKRNRP